MMTKQKKIREAVGIFEQADDLQAAIDDLLANGFNRADLSLLAGEAAVREKLGHAYRRTADLEENPEVPRAAYVAPESVGDAEGVLIGTPLYIAATAAAGAILASGGALAAAIVGAAMAGGAGALFGALLARTVGDAHARHLSEQLEHGGLLLWVRTWTPDDETRATAILKRHAGQHVHVHSIAASNQP